MRGTDMPIIPESVQNDLVRFKLQMETLKGRLNEGDTPDDKLKKACQDFEAIFISKIWQGMRDTVPQEGYLHSPMEDQYMAMFDRDFAEKMSKDGGIGLGDMLYGQLQRKLASASRHTLAGGTTAEVGELTDKDRFRPDLVEPDKTFLPELTAGGTARDSLVGSGEEAGGRAGESALDKANALAERIVLEHEVQSSNQAGTRRGSGYATGKADQGRAIGSNLATKG